MNQVTASTGLEYENGKQCYVTNYLANCGCHWQVDMWGNVRRIKICSRDSDEEAGLDPQGWLWPVAEPFLRD